MPRGSGRRPLPTAVKKLRGNPGKRKLNDAEPIAAPGIPKMPEFLSKIAQQEWKEIVPELERLGVLAKVDGKALAGYCVSYARWMEAQKQIDKHGILIEESVFDKDGEEVDVRVKRNPAISIAHAELKNMKSFLIEFGMTPAARSRIRMEKPKVVAEVEAFDTYLERSQKPLVN